MDYSLIHQLVFLNHELVQMNAEFGTQVKGAPQIQIKYEKAIE